MSSVRRAFAFAYGDRLLAIAIGLVTLAVTARLLLPSEFGLAVLGLALAGMADVLRDFGCSAYLLRTENPTSKDLRAVFTVSALLTGLATCSILALAAPIELLFAAPGLASFLQVMAITMLCGPFTTPIAALLRRELAFDIILRISAISALTSAVVTIVLAVRGFGHMSFAWAALITSILNLSLYAAARPAWIIFRPTTLGLRGVAAFGVFECPRNLAYFLMEYAPALALGRFAGSEAAGLYQQAGTVARLPERLLLAGTASAMLPSMSHHARAGRDLKDAYLLGVSYITALIWPSLLVIIILAEPLVLALLGRQWQAAVPLVQIMAAANLMWFHMNLTNPVLVAAGAMRDTLVVALAAVPVGVVAQVVAARHGPQAAALALFVGIPAFVLVSVIAVWRHLRFSVGELLRAVERSAVVAVLTALAPTLVVLTLQPEGRVSLAAACLALVLAGAGWVLGLMVTRHPMLGELRRAARHVASMIVHLAASCRPRIEQLRAYARSWSPRR